MDPKLTDWESYSAGYQAAVFDLIGPKTPPSRVPDNRIGIVFAYFLGAFVAYLIFKFGSMEK